MDESASVSMDDSQIFFNSSNQATDFLRNREATVTFRWYVTVPTAATHILFNCPFSKVPLTMSPKKLNGSDIYESSEFTVSCGIYDRCTLTIDSNDHSLESVEIKHYSFDVDLYIDETIEDASPGNANYFVVAPDFSNLDDSHIAVVPESSDISFARISRNSTRDARLDDIIDDESLLEKSSVKSLRHLNLLDSQWPQQSAYRGDVAEDPSGKAVGRIGAASDSSRILDDKKDISSKDDRNQVHSVSTNTMSLHRVLNNEDVERFEPIRTPSTATVSSRLDLEWMISSDRIAGTPEHSLSSSYVSEPELKKFATAVKKNELFMGASGAPGISRRFVETGKESSASLRSRSVETVGRKNLNTIATGTGHHQELDLAALQYLEARNNLTLAQNFDHLGNDVTGVFVTETDPQNLSIARASSVIPTLRSPLVTSRTTPISSGPLRVAASHNSPLVATPQEHLSVMDVVKQEPEWEVQSLKSLLTEKDVQIKELLHENVRIRSMLSETQQLPNQEMKVKVLIKDKENLATQLSRVKQNLDKFTSAVKKTDNYSISNKENNGTGTENYIVSSSPSALQKELDDLHNHLRDLQEVNKTAAAKLDKSEKKIADLLNENNSLRTQRENSLEELHRHNFVLKEQLHHLQTGHRSEDTGPLRDEIKILREELRVLRDKNHHLVQDNIKLTECIKDIQQFNGHPLFVKTNNSPYAESAGADESDFVSWKSKIKDERESYDTAGQRIRSEMVHSPVRTNNATSNAALPEQGLSYFSDSKDHWSDADSMDTNQLIADHSLFARDFAGVRRDSIKSDATLISSFQIGTDYDHKDHFVKEDLMQPPENNFVRTRKWSAPKQAEDINGMKIQEFAPERKTPVLNLSSHTVNLTPSTFNTPADYRHSNPVPETFTISEKRSNLKPDMKRLSVCSNSTENILLEADRVISVTKGSLKQKLTSLPTLKTVPQLTEPLKASESNDLARNFPKETVVIVQTCSKRPFAPQFPNDISIGDIVKFSRYGGHISKGQVKFIGHLPGKSDTYLGIELDSDMGKHDGVFDGIRYFQCKPNKGVFVAFCKVVMAWHD